MLQKGRQASYKTECTNYGPAAYALRRNVFSRIDVLLKYSFTKYELVITTN